MKTLQVPFARRPPLGLPFTVTVGFLVVGVLRANHLILQVPLARRPPPEILKTGVGTAEILKTGHPGGKR